MTTPDDDAPACAPILDTWRSKWNAASWTCSFVLGEGNEAVHDLVAGILEDLTPLARIRAALVLGDEPVRLAWSPDEQPNAAFRAHVLETIRTFASPLIEVSLELDLRVWFRTVDSPNEPVLAWLSEPTSQLLISIDPDAHDGWASFDLNHTLFSAYTYPDRDPNPLHALDQPLLADALGRWQARCGAPLERDGEVRGRTSLGFSSDPLDYGIWEAPP